MHQRLAAGQDTATMTSAVRQTTVMGICFGAKKSLFAFQSPNDVNILTSILVFCSQKGRCGTSDCPPTGGPVTRPPPTKPVPGLGGRKPVRGISAVTKCSKFSTIRIAPFFPIFPTHPSILQKYPELPRGHSTTAHTFTPDKSSMPSKPLE